MKGNLEISIIITKVCILSRAVLNLGIIPQIELYICKYAKAETLILWPPYAKSWLIGKDSDAGRDWGQEEKGTTEDEMAGWHHWLDGREFVWTWGVGDGQGGLACCDSRGHKESDTTEWLNWTELKEVNAGLLILPLLKIAKSWKQCDFTSVWNWQSKSWYLSMIQCYIALFFF